MTSVISKARLSRLSGFVADRMGLHFPPERWNDLARGIISAAHQFGFADPEACVDWLVSSPLEKKQIEILASQLTVGETYFFREKRAFEVLESHLLPELIRSRRDSDRRLRFWSAGCATGEEPYSLAIMLARILADVKDWNITILASDINPRFLRRASEGVYNEWSFRDSPSWIKESCFEKSRDGRFELLPRIRQMVTLAYLNLAEDVYPSLLNSTNAMDVIFCRNVLMYFAPERSERVVQNFYRSLADGGWLIVSPSETSHVLYSHFETVNFPGLILYRKCEEQCRSSEAFHGEVIEKWPALPPPPFQTPFEPGPAETCVPEFIGIPPTQEAEPPAAESASAADRRAFMLYERGHYAEAEEQILAWLSQMPDDAKAMALLARIHANQGRLQEALEWCAKAIVAEKMNAGLHYLRATILLEQGRLEEAGASLQRALYADQDFVLAHYVLGSLARRQGKPRKAQKHFENALSLLDAYGHEQVLPESEGITAGRMMEILALQKNPPGDVRAAVAGKGNSSAGTRSVQTLK